MQKKAFLVSLTVVLASVMTAASAWAYIPPSQFLLKTLAHKHSGYKSVQVRLNVIGLENGQPGQARFHEMSIFFPASGVLRSWAMDESGKVLFATERAGISVAHVSEVLMDGNPARMTTSLKASGIPIVTSDGRQAPDPSLDEFNEKTSLRRWNHTVAWVLGGSAKSKDNVPQLWLEKDTFLPLRVIAPTTGKDSDELFDLQMENYRYFHEFPYPRLSTLFEVGSKNPVLKMELTDLTVDVLENVPKERVEGFTDAGNSAPSAVRDLITTYYRFVR